MCIYPIAARIIAKDFACSNDFLLSGVLHSSSSSFPGDFLLQISPFSLDPAFCKHILTSAQDHACFHKQSKPKKPQLSLQPSHRNARAPAISNGFSCCWFVITLGCHSPHCSDNRDLRPRKEQSPGLQTLPSLQPASFSSIIFCQMGNLSNPNPNWNMEGRPSQSHPPLFESPARINKT